MSVASEPKCASICCRIPSPRSEESRLPIPSPTSDCAYRRRPDALGTGIADDGAVFPTADLCRSQPHADIGDWYAAGDIFTLPSPAETQGLVLVEAMAAGLPCVTVDEGGPREVVSMARPLARPLRRRPFVSRPGDRCCSIPLSSGVSAKTAACVERKPTRRRRWRTASWPCMKPRCGCRSAHDRGNGPFQSPCRAQRRRERGAGSACKALTGRLTRDRQCTSARPEKEPALLLVRRPQRHLQNFLYVSSAGLSTFKDARRETARALLLGRGVEQCGPVSAAVEQTQGMVGFGRRSRHDLLRPAAGDTVPLAWKRMQRTAIGPCRSERVQAVIIGARRKQRDAFLSEFGCAAA